MPYNTALFVIHEYEISCKINLFKSSFLSSEINSVEKIDSIFLVDAVLEIIIVRCYMTFRSRTKRQFVNIITKICHSSLTSLYELR